MMTGSLVDADKLMKRMCKQCNFESGDEPCEPEECFIYNTIKYDAPTVDAVPVVRCCQCSKRYDADECPMCHLVEGEYNEYTADDGFCDRGEMRTDGAKMDLEVKDA